MLELEVLRCDTAFVIRLMAGAKMTDLENGKDSYLVLGLDPGISSCGFSLLDLENNRILEMGSHLFDIPEEAKTKTSLAKTRRDARSSRRNTKRKRDRKKHVLHVLKNYGLVPMDADKQWLQSVHGDRPLLKLRVRGLDMLLSDRELAQVLYSLAGRRGYIPHGIGKGDAAGDEGQVLKAVAAMSEELEKDNFRTVGELLAKKKSGRSRNKQGDYSLCVPNHLVVDEVHQIFSAQRELGNGKASKQFEQELIAQMEWEKDSFPQDQRSYDAVGPCVYFPEEKRASRADLSSQLCSAYEQFGHLVIVHADGTERRLSAEERNRFIEVLFDPARKANGKVTYSFIRKELDLSASDCFKGVDADKEKQEPYSPSAWRLLKKYFSSELIVKLRENICLADDVCESLTFATTETSLMNRLNETASQCLSSNEIEEIKQIPFSGKLFKGYGNRSRKALYLLLEQFESPKIITLFDAENSSGLYQKRQEGRGEKAEFLAPYEAFDSTCNNPVVLRALSRMRKIVNAIIKIYGVPNEIHIEVGKELKMSRKEIADTDRRNKKNRETHENSVKQIAELLEIDEEDITGRQVLKYELYQEQGCKDIYTGFELDLSRVVGDDTYCEIDHILPISRSSIDSYSNKVLTLTKNNREKRERTPYEWMAEESAPSWDEFAARCRVLRPKLRKKYSYLMCMDFSGREKEFINRNLNDTRYMSVAMRDWVEQSLIFPEDGLGRKQRVLVVAGGATASLRRVWGLNFGSGNTKDRTDKRHHAVDAAVIAACSFKTVSDVARARGLGKEMFRKVEGKRLSTQPWTSFSKDVSARVESVIPTRMVQHKMTGRLYEDTLYRYEGVGNHSKAVLSVMKGGTRKFSSSGNIEMVSDKAARKIDGMAYLRLWLDKSARSKSKVTGKYYAEPVYYADLSAIQNGTYVPKACKTKSSRMSWNPIPEGVLQGKPLVLFLGDVVFVDGNMARFSGFDIDNCAWKFEPLVKGAKISMPTISSMGNETDIHLVQEDVLGHCYDGISLNFD